MVELLFYLKKLITALVLPPSSLLLLMVAGLLCMRWRPRLGQALAWIGLLTLTVCALPVTTQLLGRIVCVPSGIATQQARRAQAVVVLAAGRRRALEEGGYALSSLSLERLRYGARLAKERQLPLLLTGGVVYGGPPEAELMARALRDSFAQQPRWVERRSRDTHQNALYSAAILRDAGIDTVLLVTHDIHQRRSLAEFAAAGIQAVSAPLSTWAPSSSSGAVVEQLPGAGALALNVMMLHEILGNIWLWLAGTKGVPDSQAPLS